MFDAQSAAIATAHNGTVTSDVDKAARLIIELEDLGQYFTHRLGHGMYSTDARVRSCLAVTDPDLL